MSDWFVLNSARNWTAAVVHQGQRVLQLQASSMPPRDADFVEWARRRQSEPDFTGTEDHFFVTAVSKTVEWIAEAHKRNLLKPEVTEPFLTAADKGSLVRNIREHFIEYLNGGGRQKKQNVVDIEFNDGLTGSVDASSVIVTDEGRLIGGRLNVQRLMAEASALYPLLFEQSKIVMAQMSENRAPHAQA